MKKQRIINFVIFLCIYIFLFPLFFGGYILRKYDILTNKEQKDNPKENWVS